MTNSYGFPGNQRNQTRGVRNVIDAAVDNRRQGKNVMRRIFKMAIAANFAFVLLAMCFVAKASAQCGSVLSSNVESIQPQLEGQPQFMPVSFPEPGGQNDQIVGFWRAKFISEGSSGIPDGTLIDNPFVEWHADGTEIMNSPAPLLPKVSAWGCGRRPESRATS